MRKSDLDYDLFLTVDIYFVMLYLCCIYCASLLSFLLPSTPRRCKMNNANYVSSALRHIDLHCNLIFSMVVVGINSLTSLFLPQLNFSMVVVGINSLTSLFLPQLTTVSKWLGSPPQKMVKFAFKPKISHRSPSTRKMPKNPVPHKKFPDFGAHLQF